MVLAVALCCLSVIQAAAADAGQPGSSTGRECDNAQTTAAMRACENARYQQAEQTMNATYRALMSELDEAGRAKLRRAQQAWLRFRAAEADFQADAVRGGTLAPLVRTSVLADLTESRWGQLSKQAQAVNK
ncbi:MAG TPA: lysozyme inhibitor LprI family protein [Steroidobacteraceae bacterium]|nr:lysozyme inhibitor LprI family protein [Steroidobacteraceae bacterium]